MSAKTVKNRNLNKTYKAKGSIVSWPGENLCVFVMSNARGITEVFVLHCVMDTYIN